MWFAIFSTVGTVGTVGIVGLFSGYYYRDFLRKNYSDFLSLQKLVSTQYKTQPKIALVSFSMILKMYWLRLFQKLNNSIEYRDNKTIIISYMLGEKIYKMVLRPKKGPGGILKILDENNSDISSLVLPFFGPAQDWHGYSFTPEFWGKKRITIFSVVGEPKTFQEKEIIKI